MSNQLVYKGHYFFGEPTTEATTKIYSKKGLAINNCPSGWASLRDRHVVEYELVPTGRKFNMKGELIE